MEQALREALGKAGYEARNRNWKMKYGAGGERTWLQLQEDARELYRVQAEATVLAFMSMLVPTVVSVVYDKDEQEHKDAIERVSEHQQE